MLTRVLLPVAALARLATAGLYPGITTDNHTCALGMFVALDRPIGSRGRFTNMA